ncbi:HugZ family protein [Campylobacter geochelonis]|uniref:HugZ family pyridoxamine 5'-phosphate oxidase n=1 Tax=Campylobacter geochelonis TaxID=1780362 RepID=UPI00077087E3|nr:pyridoxamine 5'-phosphate oxidase family protein [Campylobacter geochelonis]CZE49188.1 pyridoxamine 5'-phosphate oxidase family protein [Campylobacter geochelonis]
MKNIDEKETLEAAKELIDSLGSLVISSVNQNGEPLASYAPFVKDDEYNFYICISPVALHFENLQNSKIASLLFIEDESKSKTVFGRKRLYGSFEVEKFQENDDRSGQIYELFEVKFGSSAGFLTKLSDFRIFKFSPTQMSLVLGFGAAFSIDFKEQLSTHKRLKGHGK